MMDMEMNAELERDGGSETGEASAEGSSAGSVYCTLEQDFAKITSEMRGNEALAAYETEYTRLFESLYQAQRLEQELGDKCSRLTAELEERASGARQLEAQVAAAAASEQRLRQQLQDSQRLADSAHARERQAQEAIERLRASVGKLGEELAQKNRQLASEQHAAAAAADQSQRRKDGPRERERLLAEIETLRQRLQQLGRANGELQRGASEAARRLAEQQEAAERQAGELAAERRRAERAEAELRAAEDRAAAGAAELRAAEERAAVAAAELAQRSAELREQAERAERQQRDLQRLMLKQLSARSEADRLRAAAERARKQLQEGGAEAKLAAREIERLREQLARARAEQEAAGRRLAQERAAATRAEAGRERAAAALRSAELEVASLTKQLQLERKVAEKLGREREAALKSAQGLEDANRKLALEIRVLEQTGRKMERSIEDMAEAAAELQRQATALEKERDRGAVENQQLAQKVEDCMDELKAKRLETTDWQKRLAEAEGRFRRQQSLFEEVRAERNGLKKGLGLAQDELAQARARLKAVGQQLEQAREQLAQREAALTKQEFLLGKSEKQKEALRAELAAGRRSQAELHARLHELRQQERQLRGGLREADARAARQAKEIAAALAERDAIGTQLARRNDEAGLQGSALRSLRARLSLAARGRGRRAAASRALRLEVARLRRGARALRAAAAGAAELRGELFRLERELAAERLKVAALEGELQSPLNVHRWRGLEAADPDGFELLRGTHLLQRRVLALSAQLLAKDKAARAAEQLYMGLREVMAKQPGPELLRRLGGARRALRQRGNRIKCLVAELNMKLQGEHKFEIDRMKCELKAVKIKYMAQKKQLQQQQQQQQSCKEKASAPPASCAKFYGARLARTWPTARQHGRRSQPSMRASGWLCVSLALAALRPGRAREAFLPRSQAEAAWRAQAARGASLIPLLRHLVTEYFEDCALGLIHDASYGAGRPLDLRAYFERLPFAVTQERLDVSGRERPRERRPHKCTNYVLFLSRLTAIGQVLARGLSSKIVVVVSAETSWEVKNLLRSDVTRYYANLLVVCHSASRKSGNGAYLLYTSELYADGSGASRPLLLASWLNGSLSTERVLFQDKLSRGFMGHQLPVSVAENPPFTIRRSISPWQETGWDGLEVRLLQLAGSYLNLSVEFAGPQSRQLSTPLEAAKADVAHGLSSVAIGGIYRTIELEEGTFDATRPHLEDCAAFVSLASTALPRYRAVLGPFQLAVWLMLCLSYLALVVPLSRGAAPGRLLDAFWFVYGTYTNAFAVRSPPLGSDPAGQARALLLAVYWLFTIIVTACYTGSIVAFITLPVFPAALERADELARQRYRVGTLDRDGWERWFNASHFEDEPALRRLFHRLDLVPELLEGVRNASRAYFWPYAFLGSRTALDYLVQTDFAPSLATRRSLLHVSGECFVRFQVVQLLPRGSLLTGRLSAFVARAAEHGLLGRIAADVDWEVQRLARLAGRKVTKGPAQTAPLENRVLAVEDTQGMFLVLGAGLLAALLALGCERLGGSARDRRLSGRARRGREHLEIARGGLGPGLGRLGRPSSAPYHSDYPKPGLEARRKDSVRDPRQRSSDSADDRRLGAYLPTMERKHELVLRFLSTAVPFVVVYNVYCEVAHAQ
ncbi:cilia- and flagella-associated protein 58-like [Phymastichus coffea]|uniref:cilia- and flagella-associated protein 58-like n=1 Tax=Phymastichus coffea TaxID=108790 RepID=UPI00273B1C64|nr:cilia- and flagella-associated protein 58-like [Phymastichus coffea]